MFNNKFRAWFATPEFIVSVIVAGAALAATRFGYCAITPYPLIVFIGWLLGRISALRSKIRNKEGSLKSLTSFVLMLVANNGLRKDIVNIVEDNDSYTVVITLDERNVVELAIPRKEVDKN